MTSRSPEGESHGASKADLWIECQERRLDDFISSSPDLHPFLKVVASPPLTRRELSKRANEWNEIHNRAWAGGYVERVLKTAAGLTLRVQMDVAGNVRLLVSPNETEK